MHAQQFRSGLSFSRHWLSVEFHAGYGLYQGLIKQLELDIGLFRLFIGDSCDPFKWWCYMRLLCQPEIWLECCLWFCRCYKNFYNVLLLLSRTLQEVDAFVAFRFIQCTIFIQLIYSLALILRFLLWFLITVFRGGATDFCKMIFLLH